MLPISFYQHHASNYLGIITFVWKVLIKINDHLEIQNAQTILSV